MSIKPFFFAFFFTFP
ncbi:hypothetical protein ITX54_19755 [Rouxiella silvae]|uniref:Uncharacterized protein n=2 Tax=Rouxiella TaxID=1565532 RepID=A0AA40X586_9GAMM|nr:MULTISPECIES: hypothetical protein [Yersiniaceae]MBF6638902.1 hypothetical protein [Rouxiella silvae]